MSLIFCGLGLMNHGGLNTSRLGFLSLEALLQKAQVYDAFGHELVRARAHKAAGMHPCGLGFTKPMGLLLPLPDLTHVFTCAYMHV